MSTPPGKMLTREETASLIQTLPKSKQAEAANLALEVYGPAADYSQFSATTYDPLTYITNRLGWTPWAGDEAHPGQVEIIEAYVLALRQQHERNAYEAGELTYEGEEALWHKPGGQVVRERAYWQPGQVIKNRLRIEAGHTVGKTKLASGIFNHFFDHFRPSIIYTFAPGWDQVKNLLWKEIGSDREGKGLPGRVLETCAIRLAHNHFATGKATNNAHGRGSHRIHGQHEKYLMFVIDEAEGVADFVFDAIDSMTSGGISIVIMLANPQTRTSRFHKIKAHSDVKNFRLSCLYHPNVLAGREVVPGAVKRQYVEGMTEKHCEVVLEHDHDRHTFDLPFPVMHKGNLYPAGTVFKPNAEYMWRVLGIAPANISDKNLITVGRYEAALTRDPIDDRPTMARMGLDVARWGKDFGTLYIRHNGRVWRAAQLFHLDTLTYYNVMKADALKLAALGVTSLHIRVDAGGGFGGGVVDLLRADMELRDAFSDFEVYEVHFNGTPYDQKAFDDVITEITAATAEALNVLRIYNAPDTLMEDLCERMYDWVVRKGTGVSVKRLEPKDRFRSRMVPQRSPDDGDGFVLAVGADHLFARFVYSVSDGGTKQMPQAGADAADALLAVMKKRRKGLDS